MGGERRKHVRVNLTMLIDVEYEVRKTPIEGITIAKNLSLGGIQLPIDAEISDGTRIELKFSLPHVDKPIYASGEVIWTRFGDHVWEGHCLTGVKFTKINEDDKNLIDSFTDSIIVDDSQQLVGATA